MKKILMIDDEQDMMDMLKHALACFDYEVITALDGTEGMVRAIDEKPDLILLDIMMPHMDGISFVHRYQRVAGSLATPIIIVSGHKEMDQCVRDVGVSDFFVKPFETFDLVNRIRDLVEKKGVM